MLGVPMFPGDSGVDQLVEIIKVLGTPTREQICDMNPNYQEFKFPQIKPHPWPKVFIRMKCLKFNFFLVLIMPNTCLMCVFKCCINTFNFVVNSVRYECLKTVAGFSNAYLV